MREVRKVLGVGLLLAVPALAAFLTGKPCLFPSLGPSAFNLVSRGGKEDDARHVIGGHLVGIVCGLLAYYTFAGGLSLVGDHSAFSLPALRLAASGIASVMLTTALMSATHTQHSPACATTLIVSLGLLSTVQDGILILGAVAVMYLVHRLLGGFYLQSEQGRPSSDQPTG